MDPLSDILTLLKPASYGFRGLDAAGDWALSFDAALGLRCFAVEQGTCWLRLAGSPAPSALAAGDVVLLAGGGEACLYTAAAAEPVNAVDVLLRVPAGHTATLNGGGALKGIGGFFGLHGTHLTALLGAIPPLVHIRAASSKAALRAGVHRLMSELSEPRPGGALLASHLAQSLLIEALRAHLTDGPLRRGWLAALASPPLHKAVAAMHADVARRWTVRDLAQIACMSRSRFAATFERMTGETPIAYLTQWRMMLAAERLAGTPLSLASVASSVGYASESAFGAAFRRVHGCSPRRLARKA